MFKKLLLSVVVSAVSMSFAFASVDVNKADQAGLDGIKGVGPSLSKTILAERTKGGDFKDWADFEKRVKGVSTKKSVKLSTAGLVVNGQSKEGAPEKIAASANKSTPASSGAAGKDAIVKK